jgi:hypothetical protein
VDLLAMRSGSPPPRISAASLRCYLRSSQLADDGAVEPPIEKEADVADVEYEDVPDRDS